jgi:multidrug efflux pump
MPVIALVVGAFAVLMFLEIPDEYVPQEDQGAFMARAMAPEGTGFEYMAEQIYKLEEPLVPYIERGDVTRALAAMPAFGGNDPSTAAFFVTMAPWQQRTTSTAEAMNDVLAQWNQVSGACAPLRSCAPACRGAPVVHPFSLCSAVPRMRSWQNGVT